MKREQLPIYAIFYICYLNARFNKKIIDPSHDAGNSETYADLLSFRHWLQDNKIYDSTRKNNPFTSKELNKAKLLLNKGTDKSGPSRFIKSFDDKNLINMMNTIANNYTNKESNYLQQGGSVPYFLQKQVPHHTVWQIATQIGRMKNKPNIVKRMESGSQYGLKNYIADYNNPSQITSFKMSYGELDGKNYAFPLVQQINGKLIDFADPKNGGEQVGIRNAFKNKDIIPMSSEADADYFTNNNYKIAYPNVIRPDYFNAKKYQKGGIL